MLAGLAFEDRNRIKELEDKISDCLKMIEQFEAENSDLEAKLAEVSSNLDHAVHQIEMLNGKLAGARESLRKVHTQLMRGNANSALYKVRDILSALTDTPPTD